MGTIIMTSSIFIAFLLCNAFSIRSTNALINKLDNNNKTDVCTEHNGTKSCLEDNDCAFWYCLLPHNEGTSGHEFCQNTNETEPKEYCRGEWHKLVSQDITFLGSVQDLKPVVKANKKQSKSYAKPLINYENCSQYKDCDSCHGDTKCAFWWCRIGNKGDWTGDMVCESPNQPKPTAPCQGHWKRMESLNCSDIHKKNSTTTTTTPSTTTANTTTTTHSPETTTTNNTTPTPTKSTTTSSPPHESEGKLTGWTIAGITISSLVVILILVGVSYKKVMKLYRARNPYHTLNEQ